MDFNKLSAVYTPIIEKELTSYVNFSFQDNRKILQKAMLYSLTAKAKRIRPLLCIASMLIFSKDASKIIPIACALEIIHTYSLIHDDLPAMDNDDLRRGQLTCHKKFGEDIAILAGDTLNTLAYEVICREMPQYYDSTKILKALNALSSACGILGMAGGQMMDIKSSINNKDDTYLTNMHALKTGALIKSCIMIPAILESADEIVLFNLTNFGYHLGLLFQIIDDILDVTGNKDKLGKSINKDNNQKKLTYIQLFGLEKSKKMAEEEASAARSYLKKLEPLNIDALLGIINFIKNRDF